jgi:cytochrome c biogenesis protein CcmG, thiol:disulfide interchange protein DsbE
MAHIRTQGPVCFVLSICLFLFPAAYTGIAGAADNKPVSPFEIEKLVKAPDFTLQDLNGEKVLSSAFKGRVVLLNFWATWCPSCIAELPSLSSLNKDKGLKAKGLEVIAVSTDGSATAVRDFLRKKGVDIRVLMDEKKSVARQFKVFSLPTTFLIDRQGRIVEKFYGEYDWTDNEIRGKIERLF